MSRQSFIDEFAACDVPAAIPAAVYDHYTSLSVSKNFSVAPDDSLRTVFGIVGEDVDDDAEDLVKTLGMELPIESVLCEWETPVETLRDMVLWLDWIRQQQPRIEGAERTFGIDRIGL